jgi:hypothetical protein
VLDAWDSAGLIALAGARPWDAIFIDVGGLSGGDGVGFPPGCRPRRRPAALLGARGAAASEKPCRDPTLRR